jgi:hypothetical protein
LPRAHRLAADLPPRQGQNQRIVGRHCHAHHH